MTTTKELLEALSKIAPQLHAAMPDGVDILIITAIPGESFTVCTTNLKRAGAESLARLWLTSAASSKEDRTH